jgi:hypothetical protein
MDVAAAAIEAAGDEREVVVTTTTTTIAIKPKEVKPTTIVKKKRGKYFGKGEAAKIGPPKPLHKLLFSDFIYRVVHNVGDNVFLYTTSGSPLATKGIAQRGAIGEEAVKRFMAAEHGWDIVAAETSAAVDGRDRGKGHETYDFGRRLEDGTVRKVEVKLARYRFDKSDQYWVLKFEGVKTDLHDDLVLVVEGLEGLHLFLWGGQNLSTKGKSTKSDGGPIQVCAPCHEPDITAASEQLMVKMKKQNTFLGSVLFTNDVYTHLFAKTVRSYGMYEASPLSLLSNSTRGVVSENLTRAVLADKLECVVEDADVTKCVNGATRGANSTEYDFKVDGERGEAKFARLSWNTRTRRYGLQFKHIKLDAFDRLYVSFETPRGIHILLHDPTKGYGKTGKATDATGGRIEMVAPSGKGGYTVASAVERFMLKQFKWFKSEYIAFVAFSDGDSERLLTAGIEFGTVFGGDDDDSEEATGGEEADGSSSAAVEDEEEGEDDEDEDEEEDEDDE